MDAEGTDMDVGLALGAGFSIRNACEMAARQREAARARQKEPFCSRRVPAAEKLSPAVGRKVRGAREDRGARGGLRGLEAVEGTRPSAPDGRTEPRAPPGAPVF